MADVVHARDRTGLRVTAGVWQEIVAARRPLLTLHVAPDADSLGSVAALAYVLTAHYGRAVTAVSGDPLPHRLLRLPFSRDIDQTRDIADVALSEHDALICLDTATPSRLSRKLRQAFEVPASMPVVNIDHHASNTRYGSINYVDPTSSSCCQLLTTLMRREGIPVDPELARRLMVGICDDTKFFTRDTGRSTFATMSFLPRRGVDYQAAVVDPLTTGKRPGILRMHGAILRNLVTRPDLGLAYSAVHYDEWRDLGISESDAYECVDVITEADGADIFLVMIESAGGIKGSFRSRAGIDVLTLARSLGGGGHPTAAGFNTSGVSLQDALDQALGCVEAYRSALTGRAVVMS